MNDRYDACVPRKRGEKTFWLRIGAAFPAKSGNGFNVVLDALPLTDEEGRCAFSLFPAKQKEGVRGAQDLPGNDGRGGGELDDEIPFAPLRELP